MNIRACPFLKYRPTLPRPSMRYCSWGTIIDQQSIKTGWGFHHVRRTHQCSADMVDAV